MPPYFGPLSADEPTLKGLSKNEALTLIRRKIRQEIQHLAPPKPDRQLPRHPLHKQTGPWLYLGIGPWGRHNAGRWYQICNTCDPAILQFLTPPIHEQHLRRSDLTNLFDMHHEVSLYFDDEEDGPAVASTEADGPTG